MIRLIIFDLDNTLTDFVRMKDESINSAIDAMIDAGLDFPPQRIHEEIYRIYGEEGIEYQKVFNRLLVDLTGAIDYRILAAGIVGYRKAREATLVLYPHVNRTLLTLLKMGIKLAVISDAPRQEAWLRLCYLGLHHMFDAVIAFEDTGERKPSPAPFNRVLAELGLSPAEAMMVGDWPERDIVGAKEIGIRTVFARYGDTFGTTESGADFEVSDISGIVRIVEGLNAGAAEGTNKEESAAGAEGEC